MRQFTRLVSTMIMSGIGFLCFYLIAHLKSIGHFEGQFTWFDWLNVTNALLIFPVTLLTLRIQIVRARDQPTTGRTSTHSGVPDDTTFYTAIQSSFIAPLIPGTISILPIKLINRLLVGLVGYFIAIPVGFVLLIGQLTGISIVAPLVYQLNIHNYRAALARCKWVTRLSHEQFEHALRSGNPPIVIIGDQTSQAARLAMPRILFAIDANSVESGYYEANFATISAQSSPTNQIKLQSLPAVLKITTTGQVTSLDLTNLNQTLGVITKR